MNLSGVIHKESEGEMEGVKYNLPMRGKSEQGERKNIDGMGMEKMEG